MATLTWNASGSSVADDLASSGGPGYGGYGAANYNWATASLWSPNSAPSAIDDVNAPDGAFLWITSPIGVNSITNGASQSFPEVFADGSGAVIQSGIFFSAPGVSNVTSNFIDNGRVLIDGTGDGGTNLNVGGTLTVNYSFQIGNVGITGGTTVTAAALDNNTNSDAYYDPQGGLILRGSGSAEARLDVQGAAGFGTDGVLSGKVELWSDAVIQFETGGQITDIAPGASLDLIGTNARIADASAPASNSALLGLSNNEGQIDLEGAVVHVTSDLTNASFITLDSGTGYIYGLDPGQLGPHDGANLAVDGTLTNSGTLQIRHLAGSLTSATNVTVSGINNTGELDVDDGGASLTVNGIAGFGTVGVLTGQVVVDCYAGKGIIEFASGQITEIANGAALYLDGPASFIADAGATDSNSALLGLTKVDGTFGMNDGTLETSGDLTNVGQILLGSAPTTLTIGGVLTNSGYIALGAGNGGGGGTVSAAGLRNTGSVAVGGDSNSQGTLHVSGAVTNDGTITAGLASILLGGPVSGTGSASISDASIEFGSAVAATQTVVFQNGDVGHEAILAIDLASQFAGLISGFKDNFEEIHLTHAQAASASPTTYSGGVTSLVVRDASSNVLATLRLQGDYRSDTFSVVSDGGTGAYITVDGGPVQSGTGPAVTLALATDTGRSSADMITKSDALIGTGDPNAVVHFTVDGNPIAQTATANGSGAWSFAPPAFADGSHTIVASETDAASNTGSATISFTLDTVGPTVAGITQVGTGPTNASTVDYTVAFSEAVTGVDASQFAIDPASTVNGASIVAVSAIDDSHYKVTVNTGSGDGALALDVVGSGIRDFAGNPLAGGSLSHQVSYATGAGPISVVIGDVNGDGNPDLVIANGNSFSTASVLLGNGDGTFQPQITVFTGTSHQVVLGDVNGDGKLDIVSANSHEGTIAVLLGNGDGTFQPKTDYAAGDNAISVAVADVNGDGKADIATADYGANTDSILLGNGDGTFQSRTAYATQIQPGITIVVDVNGDSKPDLVTSNQVSSTISVLLGNGDGTFQPQTAYGTSGVADVVAADVNGDGKLDLLTAGASTVSVLLGNGDGTFQPQTTYSVGNTPFSLAVGDINGDGKLDIAATALNADTISVLLGNGDGTFQSQTSYTTGAEPLWVAIGDLSGDGRPDLVVTNGNSNNVSVFLNSTPTIAGPAYTVDKTAPALSASLANDSGISSTDKLTKIDALTGTGDANAVVHFTVDGNPIAQTAKANGSGAWSFAPPAFADGSHTIVASETDAASNTGSATISFTSDTVGPTVAGITQAGTGPTNASTVNYTVAFSEAVTGVDASQFAIDPASTVTGASIVGVATIDDSHYKVTVNTGTGDGTLVLDFTGANVSDLAGNPLSGGIFKTDQTISGVAGLVTAVDLNGDQHADLVSVTPGVGLAVMLSNGDGTFLAPVAYAVGDNPNGISIGDLNGDGLPDLAISNYVSNGTVSVLLGAGDGTFHPAIVSATNSGYPAASALADLNGDGNLDLMLSNTANRGGVSILLGNGDGTFTPNTVLSSDGDPAGTAVGDFNADGIPDVAFTNVANGAQDVQVYLGKGDGTFVEEPSVPAGTTTYSAAIADLNRDGSEDMVFTSTDGSVSVALGKGDGTFQAPISYAFGSSSGDAIVTDVNGDGKLDVVVTNGAGNAVSVLLGNGDGTLQPAQPLAAGGGAGWVTAADFNGDGRPDLAVADFGSGSLSILINKSPTIGGPTYTIDKTAPGVTESLANDSGISSTDKLTKSGALTGSGDPNAVVHFTVDGTPIAQTATANGSGAWSFAPPALADGSHTIVASETDAAGNIGSNQLTFKLDTHGPTGWNFNLANSNFDGSNSIASGTVIGTVSATGDPNSATFTYFFATSQSGAGATQNLNGLSINANSGVITTTAAISVWPSAWLVAEDSAGNLFAKQLVLGFGNASGNTITVGGGAAAVFALGGNDTIAGTSGSDSIAAGAGNDNIVGFVGADTVNGGTGTDTITLTATSASLNAATDTQITNVETISATNASSGVTIDLHNQTEGFAINGGASGDNITGTSASDTISAGAGNDAINGFVGADSVDGGAGADTIALTATSANLNSATDKQIANIETVSAAAAASGVTINLHNQSEGFSIIGSSSADAIVGTSAKDILDGGAGADTLTGGAGKDTFVFINKPNSLISAYDTITDFTHGSDVFEIGHTIAAANFSSLSHASTGNLLADLNATLTTANLKNNGADVVTLTGTAADAGTYVIVNSGHGSGYLASADAVVKLQAGATVTATDFIA